MAAPKPLGLNRRHNTKTENSERAAAADSLRPESDVFETVPPNLKGHPYATALWGRLAELYRSIEADIVSELDRDMLIDYCLTSEQVVELDTIRGKVVKQLSKRGGTVFLDELTKVDARVDRKRDLLHKMRQSLYLTPRARAAAKPAKKKKKSAEPVDPLEELLKDIDVNV